MRNSAIAIRRAVAAILSIPLLVGIGLGFAPPRDHQTQLPGENQLIIPLGPVVSLDEVGIYSIGCKYRDGRMKAFPSGWSGNFDDATGIACMPYGEQHGKNATLLHCPWRNGTGVSFQEFRFRVPHVAKALVTGAIALGTFAVGKSDGATFRVYANGQILLDENRTTDDWKEFSLDVSRFTGDILTLRFETDPGPRDDPSFDYSIWGDRKLILPGMSSSGVSPVSVPPPDLLEATAESTDVAPMDGDKGKGSFEGKLDEALFHWKGEAGSMDYRWDFPNTTDSSPLGRITLTALSSHQASGRPVVSQFGSSASIAWIGRVEPIGRMPLTVTDGCGYVQVYRIGGKTTQVRVVGRLVGKSLVFDVSCDQNLIREFNMGAWGPVAYRRQLTVPYYSGQVQYLPVANLFVNAFLDWTHSGASNFDGNRAVYGALTDGTRRRLQERAVFAASWHLAGALPSIPNPKSPFIPKVGGRLVLDTWGGRFDDIAKGFETLRDYGIDDCTAIIHSWQRSGYDNALPAHYPANAALGGDGAMTRLVRTGVGLGYLVALHENYVDYYPNFEGFRENDVALDSDGKRVLAWFQPGTKIQSFAVKPNAILPLAKTQSPEIHRRYGTNADYLDVHSAVPPWFHVDYRATEQGAGKFSEVWDVHRRLWAFERETYQGPVFGEGANHWYWSGLLDGVEAQFGVGWPGSLGMTAPLMVDFDLLRIHPLQANHGMGYYERWWSAEPWGGLPPMSVLDQYRMQEVAYGHTGFLGGSTWNQIPAAWLEHHLLKPVTTAYAGVSPKRIEYQVAGTWVDSDVAARESAWNRVRETYANGLVVTANAKPEPLIAAGLVLPQFGWSAIGAGVKAWTALVKGAIADYAETADGVFANARQEAYWNVSGVHRIRPEAFGFQQTGPRRFKLITRWHVGEGLDHDYTAFVHFFLPGAELDQEGIRFQGDHPLQTPTSAWRANTVIDDGPWDVSIPANVADGRYLVGVGLYRPGADRVSLEGASDTHGRVILGAIVVSDSGQTIQFESSKEKDNGRLDWYQKDLNAGARVIDFGTLRTNGSVNIVRKGSEWILQTFPRNAKFHLELSAKFFGSPKRVECVGGISSSVVTVMKGGFWNLDLNGASKYRWAVRP